jgi:SAM-dependent methyltransferase
MSDYFNNYLKAIDNPLEDSKKAFDDELNLFKKYVSKLPINSQIIDIGCGIARPLDKICKIYSNYNFIGIDNNKKMIKEAKNRLHKLDNVNIIFKDIFNKDLDKDMFNLTYSTYNLIGSINNSKRNDLIKEKCRITKDNGYIITITWKTDNYTTEFLKKYYPYININIIKNNSLKTITDKGKFERVSVEEIKNLYTKNNIDIIEIKNIGKIWIAVVGRVKKQNLKVLKTGK